METHTCDDRIQTKVRSEKETKVRSDLHTKPLQGKAEMVFTDGCCFRHHTKGLKAGYGVVRRTEKG